MKITSLLLLLNLAAIFSSCCKPDDSPPPLDQHIGFTLNGKAHYFTENDSTEFVVFPALEQNFFNSDTATYFQNVQVHIYHDIGNGGKTVDNVHLSFTGKFFENQFTPENQFCTRLNDDVFQDFFQNTVWRVPGRFKESIRHNDHSFYATVVNHFGTPLELTSAQVNNGAPTDTLSQQNAFVVIDSIKPAVHPERGDGVMLYGRFEVNVRFATGDSTRLEQGFFKFCAPKC